MLYKITSYRDGRDGRVIPVRQDYRRRSDAAESMLYAHICAALGQSPVGSPTQEQEPAFTARRAIDVQRGGYLYVGKRLIVVKVEKGA